jgi:signal transduction histidine kinase
VGTVAVAVGASTWLSFRYWQREIAAAGEQQVLLAATSTRATLESTLRVGRTDAARQALHRLLGGTTLTSARAYDAGGYVLVSADPSEEGRRARGLWIPSPLELPTQGIVRTDPGGDLLRAYLPIAVPAPAVLEIELSIAPLRSALVQGGRLGIGLALVSILALGLIVLTMLEREVMEPLQRMEVALAHGAAAASSRGDEVRALEGSVQRLIERERAVEAQSRERGERLAERQGFAEVGELAAEMAHEFKRPLASIRSAIDLLEQEYVLEGSAREVLGAVNGQLERLTDTMQDLFSLARPVSLERAPQRVADLLDDALLELDRAPSGGRLEVRREYGGPGGGPWVAADRRRLRQAFANVLANAVEAMPEGGTLTIAACPRADGQVEVTVADTGAGIPAAEIGRAILPFYSTKPLGTGLGLPLVARIVAAHGGRLALESSTGRGTTVRITLPAAPADTTEEGTWVPSASSSSMTTA